MVSSSRWSSRAILVLGIVLLTGLLAAGCSSLFPELGGVDKKGDIKKPLDVVNPDGHRAERQWLE